MLGTTNVRAVCLLVLFGVSLAWASVGGSISGTVKDATGGVVPGARVSVREVSTGLTAGVRTDAKGHYTLPALPVGRYEMGVQADGFRGYALKDIVLDTSAELTIDVPLAVGSVAQTVTVTDNALHVETSSTQLGEVISGRQMTAVPLNGRSYTDLLSLQPGVAPGTSITSSTVQDVGATVLDPSGTLNPGTISVNGQREFANYFSVNGADAEEDVNAGTAIVPNLDSIAEFRVVTSSFDAEYGEFSGGQIGVVTKSGGNEVHGSAFEFLRNTDLDARNYFSPARGTFLQNQFGGTLGGPIRRNRIFFFADYQGTRQTQGIDTGEISVPSDADRMGDLSDQASLFDPLENVNGQPIYVPNLVSGPYFAGLLTQELGYPVSVGEAYYVPGCDTLTSSQAGQCVFYGAQIPKSAWSVPAQRLLQYIPAPNTVDGTFATSAYNQTLRDDKGAVRLDANTGLGLLSAYYFVDDFNLDNPYPVAQSGASVPGFDARTTGRAQLLALGDTKILNATEVNEVHLSYLRDYTNLGQPVGGRGVSLVSQGFANADGSASIVALDPKGQSVENVNFNGYSIGAAANQLIQANNTYQATETFSKVAGSHSLKFGGEFHIDQVNAHPIAQFNGSFVFSGTETGVDFADFLIGVPSQYNQSQLNPFYARNKYMGLFAQDSWRVRPSVTLNYGLRWDRVAPWTEKYNQISTFVAGAQSVVFPGAPAGILYPGDPSLCLSLPTCGPGGEDTVYYPATGGVVNGTRGPLGANFGSDALQSTIGDANYNALELSARHTSKSLEFSAAYTYSKSMDESSNVGEEVNPFDPRLSYALSSFDVKHNFVLSYEYQLPLERVFHANRLSSGWSVSGIMRFASGFPVAMVNNGDNSLIGTNPNGVNNSSIDEPDYSGGPLGLNRNPRTNGNNYFDTAAFSMNALGTPGDAKRRFFYGPGADNYDVAVAKSVAIDDARSLLLRVEGFNVFNHAQFNGPSAVDGNIGSSTFGNAVSAAVPRILQAAVKFIF
jgi:hypothetical protein